MPHGVYTEIGSIISKNARRIYDNSVSSPCIRPSADSPDDTNTLFHVQGMVAHVQPG